MSLTAPNAERWMNYVLHPDEEFLPFWESFLNTKSRNLLFVLGKGFDPRMCGGVTQLLALGGEGLRHCILVDYDEGDSSASRDHDALMSANQVVLKGLFNEPHTLTTKNMKMWSEDGHRRIGSRSAAEVFADASDFADYSDIVVDISSLPRSLYIPLIAKLLFIIDGAGDAPHLNLHVITNDNPALDHLIVAEGLDDDASYIHGFESGIEQEATADLPKVWMPILGEGKIGHLERIYNLVDPDEIAPIVPFPCRNSRRTDDLILEYSQFLFDQLRVEPSNFIYVPEQNPFGVYREITSAVQHYTDALKTLGGCKIIISAISSKLLSLGALLAAYELKQLGRSVGIAHVHAVGYQIGGGLPLDSSINNLFEIWVTGEPYETS